MEEAGYEVVILPRGVQLRALRRNGLQLRSIQGDHHERNVNAFESPAEIGPVDVVLIAVKAWQVPEIAQALLHLADGKTFFVPLQNGVESAAQLATVLGGLCGLIAFIEEPGLTRHVGADPFITFAETDGSNSPRTKALNAALSGCRGVTATFSANTEEAVWGKFLLISAFSGVGGVTRMPIGVIRSVPETRKLLDNTLKEVLAQSFGLGLGGKTVEKTWDFFRSGPSEATASMQRDLMKGLHS